MVEPVAGEQHVEPPGSGGPEVDRTTARTVRRSAATVEVATVMPVGTTMVGRSEVIGSLAGERQVTA